MTEYSKAITGSIIYGIIGTIFAYFQITVGMLVFGTLAVLRIFPAFYANSKKIEKEQN